MLACKVLRTPSCFIPSLGGGPQRAPDLGSGLEVAAGSGQRATPQLFCVIGIWVIFKNHRSLLTVPSEQGKMPDPDHSCSPGCPLATVGPLSPRDPRGSFLPCQDVHVGLACWQLSARLRSVFCEVTAISGERSRGNRDVLLGLQPKVTSEHAVTCERAAGSEGMSSSVSVMHPPGPQGSEWEGGHRPSQAPDCRAPDQLLPAGAFASQMNPAPEEACSREGGEGSLLHPSQ